MFKHFITLYMISCAALAVKGSGCSVTMSCSTDHGHGLKNELKGKIAFHAQMSKAPQLKTGSTMNFDRVDVNVGGGYSKGVFTAPVDGLYYISVTATAAAKCFVIWYLEAERKIYAKIHPDSVSGASDSATGSAPILLQKGQQVYVKNKGNRCGVRCDNGTCPTFSGFLVN